ncbi:MAG: SRPBCC family protein [Ignavibacteria bacterium]|nr:SRPBCC family protein [Ignavibacteria bacterium]MCU7502936.1 SRPBCC family protein [Ignavibacteria bacterium]MCU7515570.1 SRPBCC family protein [Ignavibacteria bacterium]
MKVYRLESKQILPISKSECWKFFSDPGNLQKITPPEMDFKIISDLPERMYPGQIIIYRIKVFPAVYVTWITEITHVTDYDFFVDEQRFGPYKFWHHEHTFKELGAEIEMTDLVHYAIPFGLIGRILNAVIIKRRLNKIFSFRSMFLKDHFS